MSEALPGYGAVLSLWKGWLPRRQTMAQIVAEVAGRHGLEVSDLRGECRLQEISWARQEAMAIMMAAGKSSVQVGIFLGGRDHTTVLHGVKAHRIRQGSALACFDGAAQ